MLTIHSKVATLAVAIASAVLAAGCGPSTEAVCQGPRESLVVVAFTSTSDLATSRATGGRVVKQVAGRVARSCGDLWVGVVDNLPESALVLHRIQLRSKQKTVPNRHPFVLRLEHRGIGFAKVNLLDPLAHAAPTSGSPFLGAAAKVGQELAAHNAGPVTLVIIGDGIVVEQAPSGTMVDFRNEGVPQQRLDEFVPLLKGLKGSCVMLVGQGIKSRLPAQRVRAARTMLGSTFEKAGVGFVPTSSPDLPAGCGGTATSS